MPTLNFRLPNHRRGPLAFYSTISLTNLVLLHRGDCRIETLCSFHSSGRRREPEGLVGLDTESAIGNFASPCASDLARMRARGLVSVSDETTPRPCALSAFA